MPKIGYSANGFGKPMEASVEAVHAMDAIEADGGGLENPAEGPPGNGAGEMRCVALAPQMLLRAENDF